MIRLRANADSTVTLVIMYICMHCTKTHVINAYRHNRKELGGQKDSSEAFNSRCDLYFCEVNLNLLRFCCFVLSLVIFKIKFKKCFAVFVKLISRKNLSVNLNNASLSLSQYLRAQLSVALLNLRHFMCLFIQAHQIMHFQGELLGDSPGSASGLKVVDSVGLRAR